MTPSKEELRQLATKWKAQQFSCGILARALLHYLDRDEAAGELADAVSRWMAYAGDDVNEWDRMAGEMDTALRRYREVCDGE